MKPLSRLPLLTIVALLGTFGCSPSTSEGPASGTSKPPAVTATQSAPSPQKEVTVRVLDYDAIRMLIESQRGKVVVVDYWSMSCPPCLKEFPGLVDLNQQYADQGVVCISVNLDFIGGKNKKPADYVAKVTERLEKFGATFDNILAGDDTDTMLEKLKLAAPPAVYVYAPDGSLAKRFDNTGVASEAEAFTYADVRSLVVELLAANQR